MVSTREHRIQRAVVEHTRYLRRELPAVDVLMAIPNGGMRNKATAGKLKAEGVLPGVWDLFLPVPIGHGELTGWPWNWDHGLWLEIKAPGGQLTSAQKAFGARMVEAGYACYVPPHHARMAEGEIVRACVDAIRDYLQGHLDADRRWTP